MTTMESSVSSLSNANSAQQQQQPPAWVAGPFKTTASKPSAASTASLPPHLLLPDGTPDYLRLILSADIYDLVKATPLQRATNLSTRLGCEVLMKREDLQPVFSFKIRGAFNMMRSLPDEQKWKGVIACSAGNHAQGVALSGAHLSIPCTIVMPLGTPSIKTANVRRLGAKVVLHGQDFDAAKAECYRLAEAHGLAVIPPFDDPRVIAGQGTVAVEICRQTDMTKLDAVFCCVGGGGLLAGVAAYVKRIAPPHVKVIGVETFDADALAQSLEKGERVTLNEVGLFSDGTAVKIVGEECFRVCQGTVDGMVRVDTDEICAAIRDIFEETRSVPEPAGALAVAGMKRYVAQHNLFGSNKRFAVLVSGANMNFSRLRFVAERAELGDQREVLLMVEIPEKAGSFLKLYSNIHPRAITEFSYRLNDPERAHIYLSFSLLGSPAGATPVAPPAAALAAAVSGADGVEGLTRSASATRLSTPPPTAVPGAANGAPGGAVPAAGEKEKEQQPLPSQSAARASELASILAGLEADGMTARDISGNEMAKSHARYMVGGRKEVENERVFQFTFPERPGALQRFLTGLNAGWNISLFNYRNAGGDTANILAGIQVPPHEGEAFESFLEELVKSGYVWREETDNVVYRRFLRG